MKWKTTKKLIKQSWISAVIALIYAFWDWHSSQGNFRITAFVKAFASAFFLIMWLVGQYLRVDKQIDDDDKNTKIDEMYAIIIEMGMLRSNVEPHAEKVKPRSVEEIGAEFNKKKSELMALMEKPNHADKIEKIAVEYSRIAEAAAEQKIEHLGDVDLDSGKIEIEDLQRIHKSLFPAGFEMAGRLRGSSVAISHEGSTVAGPLANAFVPPAPGKIRDPLIGLLDGWNRHYKALLNSSIETKLESIASFHHSFTAIHPFLDGNGRLARIVLAKQIEGLMNKKILPKDIPIDKRYLSALRSADAKDLSSLISFIKSLIDS